MVGVTAAAVLVGAACGAPPTGPGLAATSAPDEFAAVRATAEASYREGQRHLEQNEPEAALVALDHARLSDPDNRGDIRGALDEALRRVQAIPPSPTRTPIPTDVPTITKLPTAPPATPNPSPGSGARPTPPVGFAVWRDPDGRFALSVPSDWVRRLAPEAEFGDGLVGFRDPGGTAELLVAADSSSDVVSPELYAARMDLAMQRVTGYSLESAVPAMTAGRPSLRRNFTLVQADGQGGRLTRRGFQVTVLQGRTPYILSGSAPANVFDRFERTFSQVLESFTFN